MVDQLGSTLDSRIAHLTNFLGVKLVPLLEMELLVEFRDEFSMDEVYESISHIALVLNKEGVTLKSMGR